MIEGSGSLNVESINSERTSRMVLIIGIFSIVMLFAGLSSAYVISSYGELWVNLSLPTGFYLSTVVILLSSLTIHLAVKAANANNDAQAKILLLITMILGLGFGISQYFGWQEMVGTGSFVSGHVDNLDGVYGEDYTITFQGQELVAENGEYYFPNDQLREKPLSNEIAIFNNSTSSYMYALSFMHLLHVAGGLIFLFAVYMFGQFGRSKTINKMRLRLGATYWHFVDGLWLYLFLFLLLFH